MEDLELMHHWYGFALPLSIATHAMHDMYRPETAILLFTLHAYSILSSSKKEKRNGMAGC